MVISRRSTKKYFPRTFTGELGGWLSINEINCSGNSFAPKMRRNKRRYQKGASRLYKMAMFAFSNTILSMSARTRKLSKSTLRSQKLTKSIR